MPQSRVKTLSNLQSRNKLFTMLIGQKTQENILTTMKKIVKFIGNIYRVAI